MKELNEYRDEIFRRSDEKKRLIRKRRRIAMGVGIPLCLCCVLTVAVLPGGLSKGDFAASMEAVNNAGVLEDAETTEEVFHITDRSQVDQVLLLLDGGNLLQKDEDKNNAIADRVTPGSYRLTLKLPDGSIRTYQIADLHAFCETTGETVTLSTNQAEALYKLVSQNR